MGSRAVPSTKVFDFDFDPAFDLGRRPMHALLERRLRARAARADSDVELTPDLLHNWMVEEIESLRREQALATAYSTN